MNVYESDAAPCPFCDSTRVQVEEDGEWVGVELNGVPVPCWSAVCDDCGATGPNCDSHAEALERWNAWRGDS